MVEIKTGNTLFVIKEKMLSPEAIDKMVRTMATTTLGLMKRRVHINGLNAEEKPIGVYSKGYMVVRTGAYQNAARAKKGKSAGKLKDAGMFTKGRQATMSIKTKKLNAPRPKYNRTNDPKVVASLTRQMENDFKVIATGPSSYGLGYSNSHNYDKSQWVEATYKMPGKIFALSPGEIVAIQKVLEKFIANAIS